jgi:3-oxoacyl-[acyl-carrier protein] reductase/meso-butanediol dehydrogenase/(S,S)-butanediol dehydrogenase/diacetyl reductase
VDVNATNGRVVVVTGGGSGIGAAISRAFHGAGDRVAIASRADHGLAASLGVRATHILCDVRDPGSVDAAFTAAATWGGPLDILVNNAGYSAWRALEAIDERFWSDVIDTNLKGVLFACQAAARHMSAGGAIINMSSLAGKRGSARNAVYCAAKFGVNGLTQALAKELGPRGIRVNAVCPVYVQTDGLRDALADPAAPLAGSDVDAYLADFARTQAALGRLPTADEVAAACVMLASSFASAITGQCLNVDCGVLPQ